MAKKTGSAAQEFIAEFFGTGNNGDDNDEDIIGQEMMVIKQLGFEAKVDMIAAGAVLMMKRLADRHGVHILDCCFAVPKWASLLVAADIWKEHSNGNN